MFEEWMKQLQTQIPGYVQNGMEQVAKSNKENFEQMMQDMQDLSKLQMEAFGRIVAVKKPEELMNVLVLNAQEQYALTTKNVAREMKKVADFNSQLLQQWNGNSDRVEVQAEKAVSASFDMAKQVLETVESQTKSVLKKATSASKRK